MGYMKLFIKIFIAIYFAISFPCANATIIGRDDVRKFIDYMVIEHGFDANKLNILFLWPEPSL